MNLNTDYIVIQKTPCFGPCPVYKVQLYANGYITLQVDTNFFLSSGKYKKQLSAQEVKFLFNAFQNSSFFKWKDEYVGLMTDFPSTIVTYRKKRGNKKKSIIDSYGAPTELKNLEGLVENFIKGIEAWEKEN